MMQISIEEQMQELRQLHDELMKADVTDKRRFIVFDAMMRINELRSQMENKKCCGTCKYHYHDKEMLDGDYCCVNDESEYCSDYTMYDDCCECWEERE